MKSSQFIVLLALTALPVPRSAHAASMDNAPKTGGYIEDSLDKCLDEKHSFASCSGKNMLLVERSNKDKFKITVTSFHEGGLDSFYLKDDAIYHKDSLVEGAAYSDATITVPITGEDGSQELTDFIYAGDCIKHISSKILSGVYFGKKGKKYEFKNGILYFGAGKKQKIYKFYFETDFLDNFASEECDFLKLLNPTNPKIEYAHRAVISEDDKINIFATKIDHERNDMVTIDRNRLIDSLTKDSQEAGSDEQDTAAP